MEKTNVMRILEQKKIKYKVHDYSNSTAISGIEVATELGENVKQVFKTLVTVGKSNVNYVFIVPVDSELDLKKGATACNEKNIAMIKSKDLLGLTGYIHGGCSPIGMKKALKTYIDSSCNSFETIFVSGGKIGYQVEVPTKELIKLVNMRAVDLI